MESSADPRQTRETATPSTAGRRLWLFRAGAVVLGLLPFVLVELVLRGCWLPSSAITADPYVDLHNLRPLFHANQEGTRWEITEERLNLFRPAGFNLPKPPHTFRIFALGGSTTQGEPYSTETAFPAWLGLHLQAAASSGQQIEVVNCGGLSYASYRVLAILREVLLYQPDLIVVYTGHNEYLEHRTYAGYWEQTWLRRGLSLASELRTVQFLQSWLPSAVRGGASRAEPPRTVLKSEVDALLDYQGGLADYQRGATWYRPIPTHFRWNLERMVESCRQASVPLLLVRPVSNLVDCPPMKFEPAPHLDLQQQAQFAKLWDQARSASQNARQSRQAVQQALELDPEHAGANYLLGRLLYDAGEFSEAAEFLINAKDFDVCPLRAPSTICDEITSVALEQQVPLVEADTLFAELSPHGLVGNRWLVDHIHPNVEGHQLLGEQLAQACFDNGIFSPPDTQWKNRCAALIEQHMQQLNPAYFQRGKQRLEGLLLWTQGRAKKLKSSSP